MPTNPMDHSPSIRGQTMKAYMYRAVRVNLATPDLELLDKLQQETRMSASEVIRRAIREMHNQVIGNQPPPNLEIVDNRVYDDDYYIELIRKLRVLNNTEDHIRNLLRIGSEMEDERIDKLMQANQPNGD